MTSSVNPQTANPASNNSAAAPTPSYASAAGAAKKQSPAPVVATGSHQPVVAAGSSASTSHHAKSSSVSPMNGRPNIMPAVPAAVPGAPPVAHGTSNMNGLSDHSHKSSVTMSANGPNSHSANGGSVGNKIQFGFHSPAPSHSSPQPGSAPIPIPGHKDPRVTDPQNSPSPIPPPSASGGRPPSSTTQQVNTMTFGSFGGDAERPHIRTPSASHEHNTLGPQNTQHIRRGSNVSDISNQAGPPPGGMGRGNFPGGGRGRGGYNGYQPTGYPPNYRGSQGNQGRGGMPPNFGNRQQPYGTPPTHPRSPAPAAAMPQPPTMPPNMAPNMPPGSMPQFYYQPPAMGPAQVPQVFTPSLNPTHDRTYPKNKKKGVRRDSEKYSNHHRPAEPFKNEDQDFSQKSRRYSKRWDQRIVESDSRRGGQYPVDKLETSPTGPPTIPLQQPYPVAPSFPHNIGHIDLSPESGNFDVWLTSTKQNFYPGHFDPNMRPGIPMQGYPMYPPMMQGQGQSPVPAYSQPYGPGPYNPPGGQPMSRNSSQVSVDHRPASSTGQTPVSVASQGTPQPQHAQIKPAVVSSPQFTRPARGNAAITIKNPAGEKLDFKHLKAPPSPAPTSQQSKTPPIVSSTPTPPPKTSTPKSSVSSHARADSAANSKTAEEVRNEFKEKMKQAAGGDKAKEEEAAKLAAEKAAEEKAKEEERLKLEQKAKEEAAAAEAAAKAAEEAKAKQEAEEKAKAESEAAKAAAAKAEPPKPSDEPDEDEMERIIREMEEADAKREKEEEERREKMAAEKAAKKKAEEEAKLANAAENDRKLREAEAEMERLEEERERKRAEASAPSVHDLLQKQGSKQPEDKPSTTSTSETTTKLANLTLNDKPSSAPGAKPSPSGRRPTPAALNLAPIKTNSVEPPQPSAALQSLKTARLLDVIKSDIYPPGIQSPNPALNAAVTKKGTSFKYDPAFLLQFKTVFTEQPSLDFHQQVKTLIGEGDGGRSTSARTPAGGSGRQNSRTGAPGFPAMGSFGAPGGRTLPPGTTSAQRFEMSDKSMSRPPMNPIASFQRPGGAFPGGSQMSRTPSSSNMGSMPHSPRQGSRRNASKQNNFSAKVEAQAAKTMPLTQGMKIEALSTSTTGWKPLSITKAQAAAATPDGHLDPAMVQRKVKAALNKMTPENFDRISDQILQIAAQSKDETDGRTLRQVIQLTFEKATDEAHWASMYAKFCKRMLETMNPEVRDENIKDKAGNVVSGGALFRKYLLNRCQEEFERGWKVSLPKPEEGQDKKTLEAAMLSEEYYIAAAAKRRGLGLVQFIGELYKLGMLTERIMHECVRKLVDYSGVPDEAEIESLSKLLRTIGANLDSTEKGRLMMDAYFQRIQSMIDLPELPSRLQFMLMDVVDLRRAAWVSKEANKGPKTLEEVRAEAEAQAAQKAAEAARSNQRGGPGRSQMGRGDNRNFSSGFPQPTPNQVGIDDLRRLKSSTNRTSSGNVTLGPMSMLNSRSNSGRRLGPGSSLSRGAEDSAASSRTGTPPVNQTQSSTNSFGLLANMDSDHPASPPSTAASPALAKATPETTTSADKESG
ncbi:hypothetical protein F4809DRAFT_637908 [Biscogniauxia mediterranea]|nr:hypothetical protein F4809DRAFT_637908 [Biscogniauxia mediterranea]